MSRYKNNHDGTYEPIARNLQIVDSPQEEFVTEGELTEALENKQDILQYEELPEPSAESLGKVFQYIGETTSDLVSGRFYKCVSDNNDPPTYSYVDAFNNEDAPYDELFFRDNKGGYVQRLTVTNGQVEIKGSNKIENIIDTYIPGKTLKWKDNNNEQVIIGDSQYTYGLTDFIEVIGDVIISAFAINTLNAISYALYDSAKELIYVGTPANDSVTINTTKKFIKDYRVLLKPNTRYIRVVFWKNDLITWGPYVKAYSPYVLPRTTTTSNYFPVSVNIAAMDNTSGTLGKQDSKEIYTDNGILVLPANYTRSGSKTRLVIACHGSGTVINKSFDYTSKKYLEALVKSGYAVLDVNGGVNDGRHFGAPFAVQSYIKAYYWAIRNYNLHKEVLVFGASMGGLSSFAIVQSGLIPVIAQGAICPVTDLLRQAWMKPWYSESGNYGVQRERMAKYYGFTNYDQYTSGPAQLATQEDMQYFVDNIDKVKGYYPMVNGCINADTIYTTDTDNYASLYQNLIKMHNVPLKIWHAVDDNIVASEFSGYIVNAIKKAGKIAYYRPFPSGGHTPDLGEEITMTDINGASFTSHAAYYELIEWFKRWEYTSPMD